MNKVHDQSLWDAVRREYERKPETTFESLARAYKVPVSEISVRAQRETWTKRFDVTPMPDEATQVAHVIRAQQQAFTDSVESMKGIYGLIPKTEEEVMGRGWEPKDVLGAAKLAFEMQKFQMEQLRLEAERLSKVSQAAPAIPGGVSIGEVNVNVSAGASYGEVHSALNSLLHGPADDEDDFVDTDFCDGEGTPIDPAEVIAAEGYLDITGDTPQGTSDDGDSDDEDF